MTAQIVLEKIKQGESNTLEFKRCGGNIENDVLESVCSFLNRFGGDILLGVLDDGTIKGVPEKTADDLIRSLTNLCNNPDLFDPVCVVSSEKVRVEDKTIIVVHVPPSSTLHRFKGEFYDRHGDVDIIIKNDAVAQSFIRKRDIFTERKVFPYLKVEDLNPDVIESVRKTVVIRNNNHPWKNLTHEEIMQSAGLILHDYENDVDGLTLAAGLLFGRDDVIMNLCPTYWTDCLCRKVDVIRYDDREIVTTNLIDSVGLIMDFARKHTNDKFYLNDEARRGSLRSSICREMIVNCLIHREFTSSVISRFIVEKDKMYTENPTKAQYPGEITLENLAPRPRNPLIAKVFREIDYSDQLGSGMRRLYHDVPLYSGVNAKPQFLDGDVFRLVVPLNDDIPAAGELLPDTVEKTTQKNENSDILSEKMSDKSESSPQDCGETVEKNCGETVEKIILAIKENPSITQKGLMDATGLTRRGIEYQLQQLKKKNTIKRVGPDKGGHWEIISD